MAERLRIVNAVAHPAVLSFSITEVKATNTGSEPKRTNRIRLKELNERLLYFLGLVINYVYKNKIPYESNLSIKGLMNFSFLE